MQRHIILVTALVCGLVTATATASEVVHLPSPPFREVPSPAAAGAVGPFMHATPAGQVFLSWVEPAGDGHRLRFATLRGDEWSEPRTVAQGADWFVNWADVPSVIATDDGRMAAHWLEKSGPDTYAYDVRVAQSFDGGATWSEPVTPHRDGTETEHGFASLHYDDEWLHVVWLDGRKNGDESTPNEMTLRAARLDRKGHISGESELDGRVCDCCPTAVTPVDGGFIVAYRDRSPDEIRDIWAVRYVGGEWEKPFAVAADNWRIEGCPVNGPALASKGDDVAIAWFTMSGEEATVNAAWSSDGGKTFGDRRRLGGGNAIGRVDVVMALNGLSDVSWIATTDGGAEIRRRGFAPAAAGGAGHSIVSTSAARSSGYPHIAVTGDTFVVTWTHAGDPSRIRTAKGPVAPRAKTETNQFDD